MPGARRPGRHEPRAPSALPLPPRPRGAAQTSTIATAAARRIGALSHQFSRAASARAFMYAIAMIEICGFTPEAVGNAEPSQTTMSRTS